MKKTIILNSVKPGKKLRHDPTDIDADRVVRYVKTISIIGLAFCVIMLIARAIW